MKLCKRCGIEKDEGSFYKGAGMKCKDCTKSDVRENLKNVGDAYDKTEKGVIRVIYKTQKRHNKLRGHGEIPYSKAELSSWLYTNGFKRLYDEWVSSGYLSDLKPSVDRINDFIGYSFDNIRLGTWRMNRNHQKQDILSGVNKSGRRCKRVMRFDSDYNLICEYPSYNSAARDCGYSIEYQIKNGVKCRNGFFWVYKS